MSEIQKCPNLVRGGGEIKGFVSGEENQSHGEENQSLGEGRGEGEGERRERRKGRGKRKKNEGKKGRKLLFVHVFTI